MNQLARRPSPERLAGFPLLDRGHLEQSRNFKSTRFHFRFRQDGRLTDPRQSINFGLVESARYNKLSNTIIRRWLPFVEGPGSSGTTEMGSVGIARTTKGDVTPAGREIL
jgi:hypothetical protein